MAQKRFLVAGSVLFLYMVVGTVVAIVAGWPAQFGGQGDPGRVAEEFLSRGTALSAPLLPLVVLGIAVRLAPRRDAWGTAGIIVSMLLAVVFIVGSLGEALAAPSPQVPTAVLVFSGVVGVTLSGAVLVTGVGALRERRAS